MPHIDTSLLSPKLTFFDIEASDSSEFFKKLEKKLAPGGYLRKTWYEAIVKREIAYPTGLEFNKISVAIPHVEPEHIAKPYIAIVRTDTPIPFAPMANMVDHAVQTQLIVNLGLISHDEDQVAVLQSMMNMFMNDSVCEDILSQNTSKGLVDVFKRYFR